MDRIQLDRSYTNRRQNHAWWDARQKADGTWNVHFHADFVPSTDWVASSVADVFAGIEAEHNGWIEKIDQREASRTSE